MRRRMVGRPKGWKIWSTCVYLRVHDKIGDREDCPIWESYRLTSTKDLLRGGLANMDIITSLYESTEDLRPEGMENFGSIASPLRKDSYFGNLT